jgi:hypothetical protein
LPSSSNDVIKNPELEALIKDVKVQIRKFYGRIKEQIQRAGIFLKEKKLVKERDICVELKSFLKEEIQEHIISERTIDRCCPDEWKRKTKPKKERQLSFFEDKKELEEATITNTAVELPSQSGGTTLLQSVSDTNSAHGVGVGDPEDTKFNKIHQCDSTPEVSGEQNKDLLCFKLLVIRDNLWENVIRPLSCQGVDTICVKVVLDKRTRKAILTVE